MARVLIIEDERALADAIREGLRDERHAVDVAYDGEEGLWAAASGEHEVVILDLMLPKLDGVEVCRRLRARGHSLPILMLTARDQPKDVVQGLDAGANDYLRKPFAFEELLARVRALLRIGTGARAAGLGVGSLRIDTAARRVFRGPREILLRPKEYQLLEVLARHQGRVLTRDELRRALWEHDCEPDSNAIQVHVAKLRRQLDRDSEPKLLHTVRGVGYILREGPA